MERYAKEIRTWAEERWGFWQAQFENSGNETLDAWVEARSTVEIGRNIGPILEVLEAIKSPIELAFICAFDLLVSECTPEAGIHYLESGIPVNWSHDKRWAGVLEVVPQERIGRYRVDFRISYVGQQIWRRKGQTTAEVSERCVIVECDGHDYHSTKQQIAHDRRRDRAIQKKGYRVFRFPGSEIHANVFGCAAEVLNELLPGAVSDGDIEIGPDTPEVTP